MSISDDWFVIAITDVNFSRLFFDLSPPLGVTGVIDIINAVNANCTSNAGDGSGKLRAAS